MAVNTAGFDGPPSKLARHPQLLPAPSSLSRAAITVKTTISLIEQALAIHNRLEQDQNHICADLDTQPVMSSISYPTPICQLAAPQASNDAATFTAIEDPLEDDTESAYLASFTPEQRKCMLIYLRAEMRCLQILLKVLDRECISVANIAAAAKEIYDECLRRTDSAQDCGNHKLDYLSEEQRQLLQREMKESTTQVFFRLEAVNAPARNAEDVEQALLDLRSMLADPTKKLLDGVKRSGGKLVVELKKSDVS